jgi:hypothetical protein
MARRTRRNELNPQKPLCSLVLWLSAVTAAGEPPHPRDVFGFEPGADYKIADYGQMIDYYQKLDAASDRVQMVEFGKSALGRPMLLLFVSSEENLKELEKWRSISERLARARDVTEEEARRLAQEGKTVIWVDGGMHATERAHAQMTSLLAYKVATEESEEMRRIRENVILLLNPVINPDGLDIVAQWYRRNLGTPFETTDPPELYHHYVGHDNNRDWYMILQEESKAVSQVLYHQWYPQIVYNHHQTGPPWTRIFIPPFADPVNPHIPPGVITGVNLIGQAMHNRFAAEGKSGVISRVVFSMWWNGGGRTAPYFHNMVGILTETSHPSPTPRYYDPAKRPEIIDLYGGRGGTIVSARNPSIFHPYPWEGGWLHFRDAIDYMITATMATLDMGARLRSDWLFNMYRMGREAIEKGKKGGPFAYVVPRGQWDPGEAVELVNALRRGGVEVRRATADFEADGKRFPAGSYVVPAGQAFRAHLMDLMEKQEHPDQRRYPGGPPEPPYDLAGWTLPIQMGVSVQRIEKPFEARSEAVGEAALPGGEIVGNGEAGFLLSHRSNASALAVNRLLKAGEKLSWIAGAFDAGGAAREAGTIWIEAGPVTRDRVLKLAGDLGLSFTAATARPASALYLLRLPKVAMYKSYVPNMDEGWTRWILESYEFPLDNLHDPDVRSADLSKYDAIILPDQQPARILNGHLRGTMPAEYIGGIGLEGALRLKSYVEKGGTLLALDNAADFAIEQFGLPVRNVVAGVREQDFYIPGSLIALEIETEHFLAFGMPAQSSAFFVESRAFDVVKPAEAGDRKAPAQPVEVIARYPKDDLLQSGWALGEKKHIGGKLAALRVQLGEGDVVLIGFRSQFRAQPRGTFKLLFNPIHGSTIEGLPRHPYQPTDSGPN